MLRAPDAPPASVEALLERAEGLSGFALGEIADAIGACVPLDTVRAKGWIGQLIEDALGAGAGSRPVPDFERLGVELKTVPIDGRGRPRESTYVTTLPLTELETAAFEASSLAHKLALVLFVPVEADPKLPVSVRRVGAPLLWRPKEEDRARLEADWRLFRARVLEGRVDAIAPSDGEVLQVRPKGAGAHDTTWSPDGAGREVRTMRRGLYLRPGFVGDLFARSFVLPASGGRAE